MPETWIGTNILYFNCANILTGILLVIRERSPKIKLKKLKNFEKEKKDINAKFA